jgi:hypothetical protein
MSIQYYEPPGSLAPHPYEYGDYRPEIERQKPGSSTAAGWILTLLMLAVLSAIAQQVCYYLAAKEAAKTMQVESSE